MHLEFQTYCEYLLIIIVRDKQSVVMQSDINVSATTWFRSKVILHVQNRNSRMRV